MKQRFENLGLVLSRDAQKKVGGGESCTFTWQDSHGAWHTEHGTCHTGRVDTPYGGPGTPSYCHTDSHQNPTPLSSNGGQSRC